MRKQYFGLYLTPELRRITCADDASAALERFFTEHIDLVREHVVVMGLDERSRCKGFALVAAGRSGLALLEAESVFEAVAAIQATSFYLGHNQTGDLPSEQDHKVTERLASMSNSRNVEGKWPSEFLGHVVLSLDPLGFYLSSRPWEPDDIQTLLRMISEKRPHAEIAQQLQRKRTEIANQAWRLGLKLPEVNLPDESETGQK